MLNKLDFKIKNYNFHCIYSAKITDDGKYFPVSSVAESTDGKVEINFWYNEKIGNKVLPNKILRKFIVHLFGIMANMILNYNNIKVIKDIKNE